MTLHGRESLEKNGEVRVEPSSMTLDGEDYLDKPRWKKADQLLPVLGGISYHRVDSDDMPPDYLPVPLKINDNGDEFDATMIGGSLASVALVIEMGSMKRQVRRPVGGCLEVRDGQNGMSNDIVDMLGTMEFCHFEDTWLHDRLITIERSYKGRVESVGESNSPLRFVHLKTRSR